MIVDLRSFNMFQNSYNPESYQLAMNNAQGGELVVEGKFLIDRPLLIPSDILIRGIGTGSEFTFSFTRSAEANGFYMGNKNRRNSDTGNRNIRIKNLTVTGKYDGNPLGQMVENNCYGLSFRKVDFLDIEDCEIAWIPVIGLVMNGATHVSVRNSRIHHTGRDGINGTALFDNSNQFPLNTIRILDCDFWELGDDAIAMYAATSNAANMIEQPYSILIRGNSIRREKAHVLNQGRGIALCGVSATVEENFISYTPANAIICYRQQNMKSFPCKSIIIRANQIVGVGLTAGDLARSKDAVVIKDLTDRFLISDNLISKTVGKWDILAVNSTNGIIDPALSEAKGSISNQKRVHADPNCINVKITSGVPLAERLEIKVFGPNPVP